MPRQRGGRMLVVGHGHTLLLALCTPAKVRHHPPPPRSGAPGIVVEHSLYTVVNMLTGGERYKVCVGSSRTLCGRCTGH